MRARVEAGEKLLAAAEQLRFTNDAGTDVTYTLGDKFILTEYGFTTEAGRWDHWPGGFLATLAAERGVNGRVVMEADDIVFPLREFTGERIAFDISDGMVTAISGGARARHLQGFIEGYDDPRAYAVSHIGWGLNHHCIWRPDLPGIGMDGRAHYGNVLFSLGPDTEFGGGERHPLPPRPADAGLLALARRRADRGERRRGARRHARACSLVHHPNGWFRIPRLRSTGRQASESCASTVPKRPATCCRSAR